ncbi:MAG: GAF domain-containing protein [Candidatus Aminicenantes bacterium]|nr:GAF domain-containing protein [Candidatus Aminicenantes bacterium]
MKTVTAIYKEITRIDIRLKPKDYSREVLKVICGNFDFRFGSIILVGEEETGSLFAAYDLPEAYPAMVHEVPAPVLSSPSGISLGEGRLIVRTDVLSEPRLAPWHHILKKFEVQTIVWVPLFSKGKAFGTCNLYDTREHAVLQKERTALSQLGVLFSLAIISNEYIDEINEKNIALEKEIAERKKIEKELREAKERVETADKAKSEFLANMGHELRTPLNAVLGFVEILLHDEADPERKEILGLVDDSGNKLLSILSGILDLAEIAASRLNLEEEKFYPRELLVGMGERFLLQAEGKGIDFSMNIDKSIPPVVLGDRTRVERVICEMISNAFKFTEQGSITAAASYNHDKGVFMVKVADTGIGISPEKQEMIFSPFTQVDGSATRRYGGTGLGLAVARGLAAMMSGKIEVESEVGRGSTFTIELALPVVS